MKPSCHRAHGVSGRPRRHPDHHVGAEDVLGEEHPEDVVQQEAGQQQGRHLQAGQPDEGDEGHAKADAHGVHEQPVASHDPNEDDEQGEGEAQHFSQCESSAKSQRYPFVATTRSVKNMGNALRFHKFFSPRHLPQ